MHSDQRQPGCTCNRATVADPSCTTLTIVLSGVRRSSGESRLLDSTLGIAAPSRAVGGEESSCRTSLVKVTFDEPPRRQRLHRRLGAARRLRSVVVTASTAP